MMNLQASKLFVCAIVGIATFGPSISAAKNSGYNPGYYHSEEYYRTHTNVNDISYNQPKPNSQNDGSQNFSESSYNRQNDNGQRYNPQNSYNQPKQNLQNDASQNTSEISYNRQNYNNQRGGQQNGYNQEYDHRNYNQHAQPYGGYGNYGGYGGYGYGGPVVYPYPDPESQPGMSDDSSALYDSYLRSGPEY